MAKTIYINPDDTDADIIKVDGRCYRRGASSDTPPAQYVLDEVNCQECPECCDPFCYRVTGYSSAGTDCCADGGCCNYGDGPIDETLAGGPATWAASDSGPFGTSDWSLVREGDGPNYAWTLTNSCQEGCHVGDYAGAAIWNGETSKVFAMGSYPDLTVTKVSCP